MAKNRVLSTPPLTLWEQIRESLLELKTLMERAREKLDAGLTHVESTLADLRRRVEVLEQPAKSPKRKR